MPPPEETPMQPVVDLALGKAHPLPPHLQATLNPIQKRMRSALGLFLYLIFGLISVTIPVIGIPPVFFLLEYVGVISHWVPRRFFDLCTANWITIMTHLYEIMFGINIRTFGFRGKFKRRSMIIMNHVSHMDWMYLWSVVDRQGDLSFWKVVMKERPLKDIPIIGHCMQLSCFLFIHRKWEKDKVEFQNKLYYFNAIDYPIQILLFPEGGDLTPRTRERSDAYAQKSDLPCYHYCFHPRTTGFNFAIDALRDGKLDAVYDLTIAYPDTLPKTELDIYKGFYPREVHFHVKSYDNEDIPEDEEGKKAWLRERWAEKEERLKDFYAHSEFREGAYDKPFSDQDQPLSNGHTANDATNHQSTERSPEAYLPRNIPFLLYSIFIFVFTNAILIASLLYVPYFWAYMLFSCLFLAWVTRRGLCKFVMSPKQKEIEKALRSSKHYDPTQPQM